MCCNFHTLHAGQHLSFFAVFSPYCNLKNLLEILSVITVFSSSRCIAGCLQKGNAELLQSLHRGSYLCLPSRHIHISLLPTDFQEESLWICGNKGRVAPCQLCHFRWIRSHQHTGEKPVQLHMVSGFIAQPGQGGVLGRGRHSPCSWCRCHFPGSPMAHQEPAHSPAPGSCSAEPARSLSIPAAPATPAMEGNSHWFCKKPQKTECWGEKGC